MRHINIMTTLLQASQLKFDIDGVHVLRGVNMTVSGGEVIGLIGPNGAGKSTLLKLLSGINELQGGSVRFREQPLHEIPAQERARRFGYLAQGARACWPCTVEKIIELGRMPYRSFWHDLGLGVNQASEQKKVEEAMRLTETLAYRNRIVTTLSGGEHTLVMLARLFATDPDIIFADEPVAALDPYHQLHVMELLRSHASGDKAAVVILHDLGLAARFCDRLYLLHHGELHAVGSPAEVLTQENMSTVYGVRILVNCHEQGLQVTPAERLRDHHP